MAILPSKTSPRITDRRHSVGHTIRRRENTGFDAYGQRILLFLENGAFLPAKQEKKFNKFKGR
jgi:hypothetical protein